MLFKKFFFVTKTSITLLKSPSRYSIFIILISKFAKCSHNTSKNCHISSTKNFNINLSNFTTMEIKQCLHHVMAPYILFAPLHLVVINSHLHVQLPKCIDLDNCYEIEGCYLILLTSILEVHEVSKLFLTP
jgi:hypothetical protein